MQRRFGIGALAIGLVLIGMGVAGADEPASSSIKQEIQALQGRLTALESKLVEQQRTIPPTGAEGLPQLIPGVKISGYADVSGIYNFNESNGFTNTARVFDVQSSGFTPQAFELVLQKEVSDESPVGFRTDLFFGDDAEVIHATGAGTTTDQFDLQQAYLELKAPVGHGIDFKVGKFVTLLGAEVIESPSNWNFSRSYMFGYSIPFTHTGVLASYAWSDLFSTTFGVVNGWDIVDDNNKAKTLLGSFTIGPWKNLSWTTAVVHGAERPNNSKDSRTVFSNVLSYTPNNQWSFMLNYDYGREADAVGTTGASAAAAGTDNAHWTGVAAYAKYNVCDVWSLAGRWEFFDDADNYRVPNAGPARSKGIEYQEYTLTSEWKLYKKMIARLEYRMDHADAQAFRRAQHLSNYQNTVSAELIYPF